MKHLLMWMGLLLSLSCPAQTIQPFDMPILRGGTAEKTLTLVVADSARSVSAATFWDRNGRLLPIDQQPFVLRSARPGTQVIIRLENTLSLPAAGGWIEIRVSGQLRAQGRLIVSSTAPSAPVSTTPTQPGSTTTTVDLTAVYNLLNLKVDKATGLSLFSGNYGDLIGRPNLFSGSYLDLANRPAIFSGAYGDLSGKPVLSMVALSGQYSDLAGKPTLFSGNYLDLTNRPVIPTVPGWIPSTDPGYLTPSSADLRYRAAGAIDYSSLTGKPALFSGSYADLTGKPSLFSGSYLDLTNRPTLFSGAYADLTGKPTIPVVPGWLPTADPGYLTPSAGDLRYRAAGAIDYSSLTGKPALFSGVYSDLTGRPALFSGAYADLTGKPTIPTVPGWIPSADPGYLTPSAADLRYRAAGAIDYSSLTGKPALFSGSYTDLTSKPALSVVAGSGSYLDLLNKPSLFSGSYLDLTNRPTLFSGAYADLTGKPALFSGSYADLTSKPTLSVVAGSGSYADLLNKPSLFSGSYLDLTSKPTLFSGAYADLTGKPTLFSGSYLDLTNRPTLFSGAWADLTGKPTSFTPSSHTQAAASIVTDSSRRFVSDVQIGRWNSSTGSGFSGNYTDLTNKPTLFSGVYADLTGKPALFSGSYLDLTNRPTLFSGAYADLTGRPTLSTVAGSGSYADLLNRPSLFSGSYLDLTNRPTLFSGAYADLTGKPALFSGSYADLTSKPTLSVVAGSGSYADLLNKPALFSGSYADLTSKPTLFSGSYADLTSKPALFSGSYLDLTNRPSLFSGAWADLTGRPTSFTPSAHGHDAADVTSGTIAPARLGSGTAAAGKYLDGSGQWKDLSGAVSIDLFTGSTMTGSPADSTNPLDIDLNAELVRIRQQFANNLTTTSVGLALDARQGKVVSDSLTAQRGRIAQNITAIAGKFATADTNKLVQKLTGYRLLTPAEITKLGNLSGTNTGDETAAGIKSKLGITTLSGANTGDQIITNNVTTTTTGTALDAVQGKILADSITAQRNRIAQNTTAITTKAPAFTIGAGLALTNGVLSSTLTGGSSATATQPAEVTINVTGTVLSAVQTAINSVTGGTANTAPVRVKLPYATTMYADQVLTIANKGKLTLDLNSTTIVSGTATAGNIILINGNVTSVTITSSGTAVAGLSCTATGRQSGTIALLGSNEQATISDLWLENMIFTAPNFLINGISMNNWSEAANGGAGAGSLVQDVVWYNLQFYQLGRCGGENLAHAWNSNRKDVLLKRFRAEKIRSYDTGRVSEADGTTFNGMALSTSGASEDIVYRDVIVIKAALYGLEMAGVKRGLFTHCQVSGMSGSTATGFTISDNSHNVTEDISVKDCNYLGAGRPITFRQVRNFRLENCKMEHNVQSNSNDFTIYIQDSQGGQIQNSLLRSGCFNPLRIDNSSNVLVAGNTISNILNTNGYSQVSMFGAGSFGNIIGTNTYEKNANPSSNSANVEQFGGAANNTW